MNTLYLIRHSLTRANEQRLYGGSTDLPLSPAGREIAEAARGQLPKCDLYASSGMRRANETLLLMTGLQPDIVLDDLREMDFGAFEMKSYDQLKDDPVYRAWACDETGRTSCPGGESTADFQARVLRGGAALLARTEDTAVVVCHGGAIVNLMQTWFPGENRNFYQWQPGACHGYRISILGGRPEAFEEI